MAQAAETALIHPELSPKIRDEDRDSLYILPLTIVPLQTPALARARLIKNSNLESVVELFADASTGSGQLDVESLPVEFNWKSSPDHSDLVVLRKLALLPSFDVYSLRFLLRNQGIIINDHDALRLSDAKNRELTNYMTAFTRPLIAEVYGSENLDIQRFEDLVRIFENPDPRKALARLKMLASRLDIPVAQVPRFLEDYGDIFMSLSYYRDALEKLTPAINNFRRGITDICKNRQISQDRQMMEACKVVHGVLSGALNNVRSRLDHFNRRSEDLWSDMTADRFREICVLITRSHTTVGGILCALTVKMDAWVCAFPVADAGGLQRRADFIFSVMRSGIEKIRRIETSAPDITEAM